MALQGLVVRGQRARADLSDRIVSCKVSLTAALTPETYALSQLTLTVADPDRSIFNSHLFDQGASVQYGALRCVVTAPQADLAAGLVVADCRSWGMQHLDAQRGARTWQNLSVADLARQAAEPFQLRVLAKPSPVVASLERTGPSPTVPGDRGESTLQMLQRYGKDEGRVLFEAYETLYYGPPTWLLAQLPTWTLDASSVRTLPDQVLGLPVCRRSTDERGRDQRTVTLSVTQQLALRMSPGMGLRLKGVERFNTLYLVSQVEYDAATDEPATVTAVLPLDPDVADGVSGEAADTAYGAPTDGGDFGRFVSAIAGQESNGTGGYAAVGAGRGPSDRALGRYQVLTSNVGPWSRQILGRTVTAAEFRNSPALQDQIAVGILWTYYSQHGARGAAASWYSGSPERQNDRTEPPRPSVSDYCDSVLQIARTADSALPAGYTGAGTPTGGKTRGNRTASDFAAICQTQVDHHVPYKFGAEADAGDDSPVAFDCSELVQWAAARCGVTVPDGSAAQLAFCQRNKTMVSVERAAKIRGALLFHPGHVAISMGDGRHTIEAANSRTGLVNGNVAGRGWSAAALVPGLSYGPVAL